MSYTIRSIMDTWYDRSIEQNVVYIDTDDGQCAIVSNCNIFLISRLAAEIWHDSKVAVWVCNKDNVAFCSLGYNR